MALVPTEATPLCVVIYMDVAARWPRVRNAAREAEHAHVRLKADDLRTANDLVAHNASNT